MSLDVDLTDNSIERDCECVACGNVHKRIGEGVYSANITHNLGEMANAAEIYMYLWRPDELGITKAEHLITPLKSGLFRLKNNPEFFKQFNPENGWGTYEGLVDFVERYLEACEEYPDAEVSVSR